MNLLTSFVNIFLVWEILLLVVLDGQTAAFPKEGRSKQNLERSIKNARYYFSADVDDEMGQVKSHRQELRLGPQVNGSFSYSDGFILREVFYTADRSGYRVLSDTMKQLPQNTKFTSHHNISRKNSPATGKY